MPRTNITVFPVTLNGVAAVTPVALDPTNGMEFLYDRDDLHFVISNADDTDPLTVTLKGVGGNDDVEVTVAKQTTVCVGNIESFRVKKSDGKVDVDISEGADGTIFAIKDVI